MKSFAERIRDAKMEKDFSVNKCVQMFTKWSDQWIKEELDGFTAHRNTHNEPHVLIFSSTIGSSMIISLHDGQLHACTKAIYALRLEPTSRNQDGWPSWAVACTEAALRQLDEKLVLYMAGCL